MTEDPNAFQHLRRAAEPFIDKCVQRSFNSENAEWIRRTRWRRLLMTTTFITSRVNLP